MKTTKRLRDGDTKLFAFDDFLAVITNRGFICGRMKKGMNRCHLAHEIAVRLALFGCVVETKSNESEGVSTCLSMMVLKGDDTISWDSKAMEQGR